MARLALGLPIVVLTFGCTTNPDLPPGLLDDGVITPVSSDAGADGGFPTTSLVGSSSGYAPGPYGDEDGSTIRNFCFNYVWDSPQQADYDPAAMQRVCLSDFYDPEGVKGIKVLLLGTVAGWCTGCREEWGGGADFGPYSDEIHSRTARGLRSLALMYQDAHAKPARQSDVVNWARTFAIDVPFGLDADFALGAFANPNAQPFNMVVRTDTMRIVGRFTGLASHDLFALIEQQLAVGPSQLVDAGRD